MQNTRSEISSPGFPPAQSISCALWQMSTPDSRKTSTVLTLRYPDYRACSITCRLPQMPLRGSILSLDAKILSNPLCSTYILGPPDERNLARASLFRLQRHSR